MKKILLLLNLFIFLNISAQNVQLVGATYSPSAPLSCQDLIYNVNYQTLCAGYTLTSTTSTVVANDLTIDYYFTSPGPFCAGVIGNHFDNFNAGMISSGTYTVTINLYIDLTLVDYLLPGAVTITSCCPAISSFTASTTTGCTPDADNFTFTNTSTGNTGNEWYLDNILVSTNSNFSVSIPVTGAHDIKLIVTDGTCTDESTQTINVYNSPTVNLGNDTTICENTTIQLDAGSGFTSYSWLNSTVSTSTYNAPTGLQAVTIVDNNGCTASDSILISYNAAPTPFLGNDTTICEGQELILDAGNYTTYLWSNNETTQTIDVIQAFQYTVTVTDANGCIGNDEILVFINGLPNINLWADSLEICAGESTILDAGPFDHYTWSTTETTQAITASAQGMYSVIVSDANQCENSDSTFVTVNSLPIVNLGPDTNEICMGNAIVLDAGAYSTFAWSTAEATQTISATTTGSYSVMVTDMNNCSAVDTTYVRTNALPVFTLGADSTICMDEKITLSPGTFNSYDWNDGSTSSTLVVQGADFTIGTHTFSVTVADMLGCEKSDDVDITVEECDVAIQSLELQQSISLSPNPTNNFISINSNKFSNLKVEIYSVIGEKVMTLESLNINDNNQIDVKHLENGIYFMNITHENHSAVKQFVKSK